MNLWKLLWDHPLAMHWSEIEAPVPAACSVPELGTTPVHGRHAPFHLVSMQSSMGDLEVGMICAAAKEVLQEP